MSDTTTDPQGGADEAEPAATAAETTAPVETGAADTETPAEPEKPKPSREDRRFASLSARLTAGEQERARLQAENEHYRRQINPQPERPITPDDIPRIVEERVAAAVAQREAQSRVESFHKAGQAAYPDWQERCQSLMQMGADGPMSELLVEMPEGAKVAAALADDPEELEKIAGLKTERARAIALGRFAAAMESKPPPPARNVSRAPAPIRPISSGTARIDVDESRMTSAQLVEFYSKQAAAKRA